MLKYQRGEQDEPLLLPSELLQIVSPYDFKKRFVSKNPEGLLEALF